MNFSFITNLGFILVLIVVLLALNVLFTSAAALTYTEKLDTYECGFYPVGEQTRSAFNVQFFLIALLFMLFDVEIILFTPVVQSLFTIKLMGLVISILFFILLTVGFIFEILKDGINMKNIVAVQA